MIIVKKKDYKVSCLFCKNEFLTYNKGKSTSKYCSIQCSSESRKTGKTYNCKSCGKEVYRTDSNIKKNIYCSKECSNSSKINKSINTKLKIKLTCKHCNCEFKVLPSGKNRIYCNKKCSDESKIKNVKINCNYCNIEFETKQHRVNRVNNKFCGAECSSKFHSESLLYSGENHHNYKGNRPKYYGANWHPQRNKARKLANYNCVNCGISEEELGRELDVHHVIPFRTFNNYTEANELDNLKCLCSKCHRIEHSILGGLNLNTYKKDIKVNW